MIETVVLTLFDIFHTVKIYIFWILKHFSHSFRYAYFGKEIILKFVMNAALNWTPLSIQRRITDRRIIEHRIYERRIIEHCIHERHSQLNAALLNTALLNAALLNTAYMNAALTWTPNFKESRGVL